MGSNYCAARGQRWQRSHRLKPAPRPLVVASNLNPSAHQASSRFGERVEKNWVPFADPTGNLLVHRFLDDANGDAVAQTVVQGGEISSRASRTKPDPDVRPWSKFDENTVGRRELSNAQASVQLCAGILVALRLRKCLSSVAQMVYALARRISLRWGMPKRLGVILESTLASLISSRRRRHTVRSRPRPSSPFTMVPVYQQPTQMVRKRRPCTRSQKIQRNTSSFRPAWSCSVIHWAVPFCN